MAVDVRQISDMNFDVAVQWDEVRDSHPNSPG